MDPVSYTHLDVYKRQELEQALLPAGHLTGGPVEAQVAQLLEKTQTQTPAQQPREVLGRDAHVAGGALEGDGAAKVLLHVAEGRAAVLQ